MGGQPSRSSQVASDVWGSPQSDQKPRLLLEIMAEKVNQSFRLRSIITLSTF